MPMSPKQFRTALIDLDLNQVEIARQLGVTARAVRYWVAGTHPIPEAVALLIRTWLATPTSRLPARKS